MITKNTAGDVLSAALMHGGAFAEVFVENNKVNLLSMVNGRLEKAQSGVDYGLGLRVIHGGNTIYCYTNDTSYDNLMKIAKECALVLQAGGAAGAQTNKSLRFQSLDIENKHKIKIYPEQVAKKQISLMMQTASEAAFAYHTAITQTMVTYMDSDQTVLIANSDGLFAEDRRTRTRATIHAVASSDTEKQSGYFGPGALKGFELFDEIDVKAVATEAARGAVTMLRAERCKSGTFPVIIDNGFGGVIFHEACGHGLEASHVAKDASVFSGKLGEKIASDLVTAIDDGTIENSWGSCNIDDEGEKTQRTVLIENGILKSYLVDKYNGLKLNMKSTASARRQSYKYAPTSRMTNTFIASGTKDDTRDQIIADTAYGIYAKYMGGGSVNTATGDFNFAVNEAYMVRNGKICEPVRGATLIGKGAEVLQNIDRVASNSKRSEGMCGAASGSIPVTVGQPTIRVKQLVVGGQS